MHTRALRRGDAACLAMLASMAALWALVLQCFPEGPGVAALVVGKAALAAGCLLPWLRDRARRVALRRHVDRLSGLSLLSGTLPFVLLAAAAPRTGADALAVVHTTAPLAATLVGAVWLGERAGAPQLAGFIVGLGGAALLSCRWLGAPAEAGQVTLALAAAAVAAVCSAIGTEAGRRRLDGVDAVVLAVAAQGGSALALLAPAAWRWRDAAPTPAAWLGMLALGVAGAGAGVLLHALLGRRQAAGEHPDVRRHADC